MGERSRGVIKDNYVPPDMDAGHSGGGAYVLTEVPTYQMTLACVKLMWITSTPPYTFFPSCLAIKLAVLFPFLSNLMDLSDHGKKISKMAPKEEHHSLCGIDPIMWFCTAEYGKDDRTVTAIAIRAEPGCPNWYIPVVRCLVKRLCGRYF